MWPPYFATKTSFQSALSGKRRRHHHLAKRLRLTNLTSRTPRPPFLCSLHTTDHFTQLIFLPPFTPLHKNSYSFYQMSPKRHIWECIYLINPILFIITYR
jgi:hypothetical protein